ncbi:disabled homolog 1 isoform X2 [Oryzias latipes]|uniref:disabled homolog 1 isoform X2 n=1 Tax=Oryzias latipes TaxID=8090 RepID=UPI0002A4C776|nr:disabled homolog 1 isoform X2 [Oryzias latipes]XP_020558028.1 disabled homolog 1 isoform X2 [Oryzias latipes]
MEQTAGSSSASGQNSVRGFPGEISDFMSRFHGDGVRYRAKLIGLDPVPDARGEKMCWDSMMKLKGLEGVARKQGKHKQKIWLKVSSNGLKIVDERTGYVLHDQEKSRISSLTKDGSDPRALAYIYQHEDSYVLFYIKTACLADPVINDIKEVCQNVEPKPSDQPTKAQVSPVIEQNILVSPVQEALTGNVQKEPELPSSQPKQQSSCSNELMEVFSSPLPDPLSPQENACIGELDPAAQYTGPPAETFSKDQILSMFPSQQGGGPLYSTTMMPWAQPGFLGNQSAGGWNAAPVSSPAWPPSSVSPLPAGIQPQPHFGYSPHPGFTERSVAGDPVVSVGHPTALGSLCPTSGTNAARESNSLDINSLL